MSLLTIIQDAASRAGVDSPTSVIGSSDNQVLRLLAFARQEGKSLVERHAWQILLKEVTFTATATETQSAVLPSDFDRFTDDTFYNRTRKRPVWGPMDASDWAFSKSVVSTVIREVFRQRGSSTDLLLQPIPTAGDTYAFEYVSNKWCQNESNVAQAQWENDSDTALLDEELMTLGVLWRFKAGQGFDYSEEFRNYELMFAQRSGRDGGKRTLNVGARYGLRWGVYVPEGGWNLI